MNRVYLALAITLMVMVSAAAGGLRDAGAQPSGSAVPVIYDDSSGSSWRDMGIIKLLNNGTHAAFEISSTGPTPRGSDDMHISRYLTIYTDTDGNASSGLQVLSVYYGADLGLTYSIKDTGNMTESVGMWAFLPNGTRVVIAINYTAHYTNSSLSVALPMSEVGASGSLLRVLWISYLAVSFDPMPNAYNVTIPHIPSAPAENDSKWEGVDPLVVDADHAGTGVSPMADAARLYLGISGDLLCMRIYNRGYDASLVQSGADLGYATMTFDLDMDGDLAPDLRLYFNRYFSNSVYVSIYNLTSRRWIRGPYLIDYTELGDYVEFDINATYLGLDLSGNVSIIDPNYRVVTNDYAGPNYLHATKFILWPNGGAKVLEPVSALGRSFTNQLTAVMGRYRVTINAANQSSRVMSSLTLYDINPSHILSSPPTGGANVSMYLTIHVNNPESVKWPIMITYNTPPDTAEATAYFINAHNTSYSRFVNQVFNASEGALTFNISETEYRRPEGEITIVVEYNTQEPGTTTASTTPTTTSPTTTTSTTTSTEPTTSTTVSTTSATPPTPTTTTETSTTATTESVPTTTTQSITSGTTVPHTQSTTTTAEGAQTGTTQSTPGGESTETGSSVRPPPPVRVEVVVPAVVAGMGLVIAILFMVRRKQH